MEWLVDLAQGTSAAHSVLVLSVVAALGLALGGIRVFGVSLGIGGVLFSGILFGHFRITIDQHVLEFAREFGLILFVYTIGLQVGPSFLASLRRQGLPLNLMAGSIVALGVVLTIAIWKVGGIPAPVAVGLFSGATTNTPALAAAQQALRDLPNMSPEATAQPGLGYAVAYPFGILGIILAMLILRWIFRIRPAQEAAQFQQLQASATPRPATMNIEILNPNMDGLEISRIPGFGESGVVISRVLRGNTVEVAQPDTILRTGDIVLAVGSPKALEELRLILGRISDVDVKAQPSRISASRILVTKPAALGKRICDLDFLETYDVTITRVIRAEIEFTPDQDFRLQFGDRVVAVGEQKSLDRVADALGNSMQRLNNPQVIPIMVGIALGILVGSIPFTFPGLPAPVRLGLAGGPLLVAIILSRVSNVGSLVWYLPVSANHVLREVGIVLFLACVGLKSGEHFVNTLLHGDGLYWMGCAALITLLPILIVGFVARAFMKLNYMSLCGLLAGSMTDPPALAFANSLATSDAPSVSYATVYPLTMLLRVVSAQILVLTLTLLAG
ncbi:MAG: putative transporter [Candidatus Sumerlaeaceae bacterium]|nr:putative transporter [Candidatus Sumerlaeaceae bacterium]